MAKADIRASVKGMIDVSCRWSGIAPISRSTHGRVCLRYHGLDPFAGLPCLVDLLATAAAVVAEGFDLVLSAQLSHAHAGLHGADQIPSLHLEELLQLHFARMLFDSSSTV